jgi:hypothetical protein
MAQNLIITDIELDVLSGTLDFGEVELSVTDTDFFQVIDFGVGFNFFSLLNVSSNETLADVFSSHLNKISYIKNDNEQFYYPSSNTDNIGSISPFEGFFMYAVESFSITRNFTYSQLSSTNYSISVTPESLYWLGGASMSSVRYDEYFPQANSQIQFIVNPETGRISLPSQGWDTLGNLNPSSVYAIKFKNVNFTHTHAPLFNGTWVSRDYTPYYPLPPRSSSFSIVYISSSALNLSLNTTDALVAVNSYNRVCGGYYCTDGNSDYAFIIYGVELNYVVGYGAGQSITLKLKRGTSTINLDVTWISQSSVYETGNSYTDNVIYRAVSVSEVSSSQSNNRQSN